MPGCSTATCWKMRIRIHPSARVEGGYHHESLSGKVRGGAHSRAGPTTLNRSARSEPQPSHSVRYSRIARLATDCSHQRRARHAAFRGFGNHGHDLATKPFVKFLGGLQGFETPPTEFLLSDLVRTSATLLILGVQVPCIDGIESQAETTLRH